MLKTMNDCPVCEQPTARHFIHCEGRDYWRCEACLASFLHPQQLPETEQEHALYRLHDNCIDDPGYRRFLSRLSEPLLAKLPSQQHGLDYGCGPGPALAEMLRENGHLMAIYDPLFYADNDALQNQYDFITCTEVAEHFHHPAEEFRRLKALLKPGGVLAIMTCFQTEDSRFPNWHYRRDPTHVVFYREETFYFLAKQFGWQCEVPCKDVVLMQKSVRHP